MQKSVIGIIPARFQSSRFPGKLLKEIHGKPLIYHTFQSAKKAELLEELYVATDSDQIANYCTSINAQSIMTSSACQNGTERIIEAIEKTKALQSSTIIVNIQGDEPLIQKETINRLITLLQSDPKASMATAVIPITDEEVIKNPARVKCVIDQNSNALYFSRSQIPYPRHSHTPYYQHLGIYAYRTEFLQKSKSLHETPLQKAEDLEQLKFLEHGHTIKVAIVDEKSIGVDTPEDIHIVEKLLCKQNTSLSQEG